MTPDEGEDFTSGEMRALWSRVNRGFRGYIGVLMADIQHAIDTGEIKTPMDDEARKALARGLHVMLFLAVMTGLFYVVKKRVWSDLH
mgnify:CR=1 FL=1